MFMRERVLPVLFTAAFKVPMVHSRDSVNICRMNEYSNESLLLAHDMLTSSQQALDYSMNNSLQNILMLVVTWLR